MEIEVSEQEGEPIYETMQRIKANPLLEQVYRQIVMPLLDQLMAAVRQAEARQGGASGPAAAPGTRHLRENVTPPRSNSVSSG